MFRPNKEWMKFYSRFINTVSTTDITRNNSMDDMLDVISGTVQVKLAAVVKKSTYMTGGVIDYNRMLSLSRTALRAIGITIQRQYDAFAARANEDVKNNFMSYREEAEKTLVMLGIEVSTVHESRNIEEAGESTPALSVAFKGKPSAAFQTQLKKQYKSGKSAKEKIRTLSADHVNILEKHVLDSIHKGKGYSWTADKLIKEVYPAGVDESIRQTMKYQAERIARTSYRDAVNEDMMGFLVDNSDVFYGARRTANGDPCVACIMRDGEFIALDSEVDDHPNGCCIAVPLTYPSEFFKTGEITQWPAYDVMGQTMYESFLGMAEGEQQKILGRATFDLWKTEQFDLHQIVSYNTSTPLPYYKVITDLDKIGAKSFPNCNFANAQTKTELSDILDPRDRSVLAKDSVVSGLPPEEGFLNASGLRADGVGKDVFTSKLPVEVRARLSALYNLDDPLSMHWSRFNEFARDAGLWTRKSISGKLYYIFGRAEADDLGIAYGRMIGGEFKSVAMPSNAGKLRRTLRDGIRRGIQENPERLLSDGEDFLLTSKGKVFKVSDFKDVAKDQQVTLVRGRLPKDWKAGTNYSSITTDDIAQLRKYAKGGGGGDFGVAVIGNVNSVDVIRISSRTIPDFFTVPMKTLEDYIAKNGLSAFAEKYGLTYTQRIRINITNLIAKPPIKVPKVKVAKPKVEKPAKVEIEKPTKGKVTVHRLDAEIAQNETYIEDIGNYFSRVAADKAKFDPADYSNGLHRVESAMRDGAFKAGLLSPIPEETMTLLDTLWQAKEYDKYFAILGDKAASKEIRMASRGLYKVCRQKAVREYELSKYAGKETPDLGRFFSLKATEEKTLLNAYVPMSTELRTMYYKVGPYLTDEQLLAEKNVLIKRILNRVDPKLHNVVSQEIDKYSLKMLNKLDVSGLSLKVTSSERGAFYQIRNSIELGPSARSQTADIIHHELGHAVDWNTIGSDYTLSNASPMQVAVVEGRGVGMFTSEEVANFNKTFRLCYDEKRTGGVFTNTDGLHHKGKFLDAYDGRVYNRGAGKLLKKQDIGLEYFASNFARYLVSPEYGITSVEFMRRDYIAWQKMAMLFAE